MELQAKNKIIIIIIIKIKKTSMVIYMWSQWSYQLSINYLQESSFVILSWKGKWCAQQGLVMLGNKLQFSYCVVLQYVAFKAYIWRDAVFSLSTFPPLSQWNCNETGCMVSLKNYLDFIFIFIYSLLH